MRLSAVGLTVVLFATLAAAGTSACESDDQRPVATIDPAASATTHQLGEPVQLASGIAFTLILTQVSEKLAAAGGQISSGQPLQDLMLLQVRFENASDRDAMGPELRVICTGVIGNRLPFGRPDSYDPAKRLHPGAKFEGYSVVSYPRYCDEGVLVGEFQDGTRVDWVLPPRN